MYDSPAAWRCLLHMLSMGWDPCLPEPAAPIPWPEVMMLAERHEVTHLLHLPACRIGTTVPENVSASLRKAYLAVGALNSRRFSELRAVQEALLPLKVPILLLKGAALAETLYQNLALRSMGDLDLAVPIDRVAECGAALVARGYRPHAIEERPGSHLLHRGQQAYLPPPLFRSPVGLHWHPIDLPYYLQRIPTDWCWNNTGSHQVHGLPVLMLTGGANFLYLSAHLALHHRLQGLPWLVDLAWLVRMEGDRVPWASIVRQASEFDLLLALRATLEKLAALWPSLPLAEPLAILSTALPSASEERIFRLVIAEPRTPFLDFATDIVGLPDLRSRARFVLANTFPQRSYMRHRYPAGPGWLLPFWYAYRLGDGAGKSLRTLGQLLRMR